MAIRKRFSYNDAASGREEPEVRDPMCCCAHGCPMPAGITRDGKRYCAVHYGIEDFRLFSAMTERIRRREDLVEMAKILRDPRQISDQGANLDDTAVANARAMFPEIQFGSGSRVAAIAAVEEQLIRIADPGRRRSTGYTDDNEGDEQPVSVASAVASFAAAKRMPA